MIFRSGVPHSTWNRNYPSLLYYTSYSLARTCAPHLGIGVCRSQMSLLIEAHNGTLIEFVGDEILALCARRHTALLSIPGTIPGAIPFCT